MPTETCDTCRYWHRHIEGDTTKGECRIEHPVYVKRADLRSQYPETTEDMKACGEHAP